MEIVPIDIEQKYGITKCGKVWSYPISKKDDALNAHNGKWIKTSLDRYGYERVCMSRLKTKKNRFVHRLVAEAFVKNKSDFDQVNHIDGNKQNNNVSNLEWCSNAYNIRHRVENCLHSRGEKQKRNTSGFVGVRKSGKKWMSSITFNGKVIYLGVFSEISDAAKAYEDASKVYHPERWRK